MSTPFPGSRKLTFGGYTAYYSEEELRFLAGLPDTPENENAAKLIHAAKVHLDAHLVAEEER